MTAAQKAVPALLRRLQHTTLILLGSALLGIIVMFAWARVTVPAEPESLVALRGPQKLDHYVGDSAAPFATRTANSLGVRPLRER